MFGETLARFFSDEWDLSMICLRIGRVHLNDRPNEVRDFSVWCSHADIAQMIRRCIDAPEDLKFGIYYVVSDNKWNYRSLDNARRDLGYEPRDTAERFRDG